MKTAKKRNKTEKQRDTNNQNLKKKQTKIYMHLICAGDTALQGNIALGFETRVEKNDKLH